MASNKTTPAINILAKAYLHAKRRVILEGFDSEIDWQYSVSFSKLSSRTLLEEVAWVILNSGMKEAVVRPRFPRLLAAFNNFESVSYIAQHQDQCREEAMRAFGHSGKINAILYFVNFINVHGFEHTKKRLQADGVDFICQFPYFGAATSRHLAKNIGLGLTKPDRHLVRLARSLGYDDVQKLCADISFVIDEPVPVVDIVIWRFATLRSSRLMMFSQIFNSACNNRISFSLSS